MQVEIFKGNGKSLKLTASGIPETVFFLHGFPGLRSIQNRDIAQPVSELNGNTAQVLLYEGLGCAPGEFSFSRCREAVVNHFRKHLDGNPGQIDVVGHSWGGFLALQIAGQFPDRIRKLVLMSPLLKFFSETDACEGFKMTAEEYPVLSLGDTAKLARDFVEVRNKFPLEPIIANLKIPTLFLQARVDDRTPLDVAEEYRTKFSNDLIFEILDTDHSFLEDRPQIAKRIAKYLA
jgi:pimeloyl-ACP methyl ester carboxylesterase